jgi:hypothetical protein
MKPRVAVVLIVVISCLTGLFCQGQAIQDNRRTSLVSLIRVIANPNDFNGQPIKVVGALGRGGGLDNAVGLFVSETDGRNFIIPNSIDLHLDESKVKNLMGKYVVLSGTYHAPAPQSGYNGYIDRISELKPWNIGDAPK